MKRIGPHPIRCVRRNLILRKIPDDGTARQDQIVHSICDICLIPKLDMPKAVAPTDVVYSSCAERSDGWCGISTQQQETCIQAAVESGRLVAE